MAGDKNLASPVSRKKKRKYFFIRPINIDTGEVYKGYVISDFWLEQEEDKLMEQGRRIGSMFPVTR